MKRARLLRAAGPALLLAIGGAYAIASWNWCGRWERAPAALQAAGLAHGALRAGAARVELSLPYPVTVAGHPPPRPDATRASSPLHARAVVLEVPPVRVGIVSLDLLTAPTSLVERIREEAAGLGFSDVWVIASHAHSSVGGYDPRLVSELAGTGNHREDIPPALTQAAVEALRAANEALAPARVQVAVGEIGALVRARSGGEADPRFTRVQIEGETAPIAELWLVAAHPTLVSRETTTLSPDYPGLLPEEPASVIVLQTSVGNASAAVPEGEGEAPVRFARALKDAAPRDATALGDSLTLGFSRVTVGAPRPDSSRLVPWFSRAAGDNFLCTSAERTFEVSALRIGDRVWLSVPGEPTYGAARSLEAESGADRVLALTNGYLGYVETAEQVESGAGESKRQYFGPELLEIVGSAAKLAVGAVKPGRPAN